MVQQERAAQGGKCSHLPIVAGFLTYRDFYEGGQRTSSVAVLASSPSRKLLRTRMTSRVFPATVLLMVIEHKCMQRCSGKRDAYLTSTSEPFNRYVYTSSQLYEVAPGAPMFANVDASLTPALKRGV